MTDKVIKLFCTDPGLKLFGWSLIEYNTKTGHVVVVRYGTITGKSLVKSHKEMQSRFEKRYIILWELERVLQEMFLEYSPDYVVSESAFSHSFIQAYAALILVIQSIRTASMKVFGRDIYLIAPRESKKAVSEDGNSDKEAVQSAIFRNSNITILTKGQNSEPLSEHAYDSIAAGVAFIKNYLPSIVVSQG